MNLYELSSAFEKLSTQVEAGELSQEDAADTLEALEMESSAKLDNYAKWRASVMGDIAAVDGEIKRLQAMKKSYSTIKGWIETQIRDAMTRADMKKCKGVFSISIGKPPASVSITDQNWIPERFLIKSVSVDTAGIRAALNNGENVEGAELQEGAPRLTIK